MAENEPKSSQRDIVILQLCEYITIITETGCESLACVIILDELDDHVSVFFCCGTIVMQTNYNKNVSVLVTDKC